MGTPMVAAKVWNGADIDSEEIRLYRRIYHVPNTISNRAIQHITTQIRPARGVVERLASKAWHMFKRNHGVLPEKTGSSGEEVAGKRSQAS